VGDRPPPFEPSPPLWRRRRPRRDARPGAVGRADTAGVGQAPLCIWAERGFGREALKLIFLFSDFIQIHANSKICVGFI
jgi:hypothetical protein